LRATSRRQQKFESIDNAASVTQSAQLSLPVLAAQRNFKRAQPILSLAEKYLRFAEVGQTGTGWVQFDGAPGASVPAASLLIGSTRALVRHLVEQAVSLEPAGDVLVGECPDGILTLELTGSSEMDDQWGFKVLGQLGTGLDHLLGGISLSPSADLNQPYTDFVTVDAFRRLTDTSGRQVLVWVSEPLRDASLKGFVTVTPIQPDAIIGEVEGVYSRTFEPENKPTDTLQVRWTS
jgi:hypothetical protein